MEPPGSAPAERNASHILVDKAAARQASAMLSGMRIPLLLHCDQPWDKMAVRGTQRHCSACRHDVHDLSAMSRAEAQELITAAPAEGLCISYRTNDNGEMIFADDRLIAPQRLRLRGLPAVSAQLRAGVMAMALGSSPGCVPGSTVNRQPEVQRSASPAPPTAPASQPPTQSAATHADSKWSAQIDTDHDRIVDAADKCPYEPGPLEFQGCPPPRGRMIPVPGRVEILTRFEFSFGNQRPLDATLPLVQEVARVLQSFPEIELLAVVGHATSDEPRPRLLSEQRASIIMAALVSAGVAPQRLRVEARGAKDPILPNTSGLNRERSRRVEFFIEKRAGCEAPKSPL